MLAFRASDLRFMVQASGQYSHRPLSCVWAFFAEIRVEDPGSVWPLA